jgi:hypothetical protein
MEESDLIIDYAPREQFAPTGDGISPLRARRG